MAIDTTDQESGHRDRLREHEPARSCDRARPLTLVRVTAGDPDERRTLEIVCLNDQLDGVSLVCTKREPFNVLTEGLEVAKRRGDRTPVELFASQIGLWKSETLLLVSP